MFGGARDQVLHAFQGGSDGAFPSAGLLEDRSGSLYGTTVNGGGSANAGTVFKLTPAGTGYTERILYSFRGGNDASYPEAALLADQSGALYGTAGGGTAGTVFKLTPSGSGYIESVLYSFPGGAGGAAPQSALVADSKGALYGTTWEGGINSRHCIVFAAYSCGVVYKLTPAGTGYTESVLYAFQGYPNDGGNPGGSLTVSKDGSLYGVTAAGGNGSCNDYGYGTTGCGTVFKLTPSGSGYAESLLYQFQDDTDGVSPHGTLLADKHGALYGTTSYGGERGYGIAFKLTPAGPGYKEKVVYNFGGQQDAGNPYGGLVADVGGSLYGSAAGGIWGKGTIFKLTPVGKRFAEKLLCQFRDHHDGQLPNGSLISDSAGWLYGTTLNGGSHAGQAGTVFKVKQ